MAGRLEGKHILVTAAGQGIGRAIAEQAAGEGATVLATDINERALAELASTAGIETAILDVTKPADIERLGQSVKRLDGLANVAGYVHHGTLLDASDEDMRFSFELNVQSMHRILRVFLPKMLEGGGGAIVNIASGASSISGAPNRFAYGTTKGAVIALTKSVAADFIARGIRCNAVCPGTIDTPSLGDRINAFDDPAAARKAFIARQPIGRLGTAAEVAQAAIHLLGDESSYTTGTTLIVDGGWTL